MEFRQLSVSIVLTLALLSCTRQRGQALLGREPPRVLTKDDVALVGSRPLTLADFSLVQRSLPGVPAESALWAALAALALQNEAATRKIKLTSPAALLLAKYALLEASPGQAEEALRSYLPAGSKVPNPEAFRNLLEQLLAQSAVQKNTKILAEFGL